jgi:hypothetical protein
MGFELQRFLGRRSWERACPKTNIRHRPACGSAGLGEEIAWNSKLAPMVKTVGFLLRVFGHKVFVEALAGRRDECSIVVVA